MGDRILSVNSHGEGVNDLPLLRRLMEAFESVEDVPDKALAYALNVSPSQVSNWKRAIKKGRDIQVNNATRNEILSLMEGVPRERIDGAEWVLRQVGATVGEIRDALRVQRAFAEMANPRRGGSGDPPPSERLRAARDGRGSQSGPPGEADAETEDGR